MSAAESRSTMNTVLASARTLSSVSWPSTQTMPSLSIHLATLVATARTGHGFSGDWPGSTSVICPAPLGSSLGGRAGDPVGQQGLEGRARLGGAFVGE